MNNPSPSDSGSRAAARVAAFATAVVAAGLAAGALALWLRRAPAPPLKESVPGMDGRPAGLAIRERVRIGTMFEAGPGVPSVLPGEWPGFRGGELRNVAPAPAAPLAESWPTNGPPVLWSVDLGEGHAAAAVRAGRVYVLDYDELRRADTLRCLSLDDGREIWRRGHVVPLKRNHGLSRTVPAVSERHVVSLGPRGHVMCVEADTGRFLWGLDLEERFGTQIPEWYAGQCPRLDGETAVLAPCGANVFMLGVNCRTGVTEWEAPAPAAWRMSHSSIADGVLAGRRVYVYAAIGGVAGVAADGPDRGRILWKTDAWKPSVIAPTPVVLPGDRVFLTAGYGGGGVVLQIARDGQTWSATVAREYNPRGGLACEQQTPIFWQGRLFGVLPKDAGARRNQFACADAEGVILWTSGPEHRFGLGPFLMVGDRLLVLDDEGTLTMARASAERFEPMARARVLQGVDSWGPMALAGTRLLVRDSKRMVCLELGVVR